MSIKKAIEALEKHYPYENESGIIRISLGHYMNAMQFLREAVNPEPHGWIVNWPCSDGTRKPIYHHGEKKPSFGEELDNLLKVYPVYNKESK